MFSFLKKRPSSRLKDDWWTQTFTKGERATIETMFEPVGGISAEALACSKDPSGIGNLVGHLKKEDFRHLGYKLLERADSLMSENVPVLSRHFYYQARGDFFYRWRDWIPLHWTRR